MIHKHQDGFVLLTTIFMLFVMLLLTLSQWQSLLLFQKMIGRLWQQEDRLLLMDKALEIIWNRYQLHQEEGCITVQEPYQHCQITLKSEQFQYHIELLGLYPCIRQIQGEQQYSTSHIQIVIETTSLPRAMLKARLATRTGLIPCLTHEYRYLSSSLMSWQLGPI